MGPSRGTPTAEAVLPPRQRDRAPRAPETPFPRCEAATSLTEACHGLTDDLHAAGYDLPSVYLLTGQRLRCHAARGYFQVVDGFRPGTGVIGRVVATGVAELIPDVRRNPEFIAAVPGLVAEACTPVRAGGAVVGAVNVESRSVLPPDAAAVLAAAADVLGRRLEELGLPSLSPAQRLAHVAVELTAASTVDELEQRAVAAAVELSGMSSAALAHVGEGAFVTCATGPLAASLRAWTAEDLSVMASWVGSDTSSHFPGGEEVPREYAFLLRSGARAVSVQPLVVAGLVHGLLVVADEQPVEHAPAVVDSLELLAAQTAASLGMALLLRDVSRRAERDDLTGLRNRLGFTSTLTTALDQQRPQGTSTAVLLLDLDDFKHVNDSLGHQAGDRLLVAVAAQLTASLRAGDVACRLGGDEFVVVLPVADEEAAGAVAERLLDAVAEASAQEGRDLGVTASVGIALTAQAGSTPEELLRAADLAMYLAKDRGKGRCALFAPEMQAAALRRMDLTRDLRRALREELLHLAYQPVVDVVTGRVTAVEALCRWTDPARGDVPPSEFVPLAEETGDVVALGEWVLRTACAQLRDWDAAGADPGLALCVNVSTRQLERPGLLDVLDACLSSGVAPERLVLEITETALADDSLTAQRVLHEVRARGVHVAVDDFGTGYSSLARLRTAPVTRLKVDRSFVSEIGTDGAPAPIVDATVAMARGLGLGVVAEGVETRAQLEHLRRLGCPEAQGFLLTRPLPPDDVLPLLLGDLPWREAFPAG